MKKKINSIKEQLKCKLELSSNGFEKLFDELTIYPKILKLLYNSLTSNNKFSLEEIRLIVMGLIHGQSKYISEYIFVPNNVVLEELKNIDEKESWKVFQEHRDYVLKRFASEKELNPTKITLQDAKPFNFISLQQQAKEKEKYERIGKEIVREGRMIHFEPVGGSATRFRNSYSEFLDFPIFSAQSSLGQKRRTNFDKDRHPKSIYPIAPISGKSFLEIQFQRRIATCLKLAQIKERNIIPAKLPVTLIMVTESTRKEVEEYLERNEYFGLRCVIIESQDEFYRLIDQGENTAEVIPVDSSGNLSKTGNGIGAMFQVLNRAKYQNTRLLDYLKSEKIKILSMGNCDNASIKGETRWAHLGRMADLNLGMLVASVPKSLPHKNVGLYVLAKKQLFFDDYTGDEYIVAVLEYAERTEEFNTMEFNTGNTNVILYNLDELMGTSQKLPEPRYRYYTNKIINLDNGKKVSTSSIESYHFDVSVQLEKEKVQAVEIKAEDYYWATKNALGERSILTTWRYWFNHSSKLLESNGAKISRIELSENLTLLQKWQKIVSKIISENSEELSNIDLKSLYKLIKKAIEFNVKQDRAKVSEIINQIILHLEEIFSKLKKADNIKKIRHELLKIYHSPKLGDSQAHIEISPYFAITEDDIKNRALGKGWKIEKHAQLLIEGRYTNIGDNLHLGENSALILHVMKEVDTSGKFNTETRELLDNPLKAGAIQIGKNLSVYGKLEIIVEGNSKLIIPDDFVIPEKIEQSINIKDGKTYTLKNEDGEIFWIESERSFNLEEKELQRINDEQFELNINRMY